MIWKKYFYLIINIGTRLILVFIKETCSRSWLKICLSNIFKYCRESEEAGNLSSYYDTILLKDCVSNNQETTIEGIQAVPFWKFFSFSGVFFSPASYF